MEGQYAFDAFAAQQNSYLMQAGMQGGMQGGMQRGMQRGMQYEDPLGGIDYPGLNDVMCGRGGGTNNHIGNIRFRLLVNEHKLRYLAASKVDKPRVAMEVVHIWRALEPPGRYLTKTDPSQGDDSLWHDVGDKKAREKASQCLRERTPDVMPFVKQQQEQDKIKKEEDKKKKEDEKSQKSAKSGKTKGGSSSNKKSADAAVATATAAADTIDTIVSGETTTPDDTLSLATHFLDTSASVTSMAASTLVTPHATPDVTHSSTSKTQPVANKKQKRRSRDEVAQTIPTAAALMANVFDDEGFDSDEDDTLSYATYQKQMHEFLESTKVQSGDEYSVTDRSILMETMSSTSKEWGKSFQSIDNGGDADADGSTMMMSIGTSIRDVEDSAEMPPPYNVARSGLTSNRSQKMSQAGINNISMLSDLTDFSSTRNKSSRSGSMQNAKAPSNFSMMSELTDLSEGLKDMGLQQGNDS